MDKRMSNQVEADILGDAWKGYVLKITGGHDKQGFPMKQGVLTAGRVRLLLKPGQSCYRAQSAGERRRKSVRGCIVSSDLAVIFTVIVKKGDNEIEGLTDVVRERRRGPKRANKIRKLFNLAKEDDVTKFVVRRTFTKEGKKPRTKSPKVQRLITPARLARKARMAAVIVARSTKTKKESEEFNELVHKRSQEAAAAAKKRSLSRKLSERKVSVKAQ